LDRQFQWIGPLSKDPVKAEVVEDQLLGPAGDNNA
jgi:hypothetical protein